MGPEEEAEGRASRESSNCQFRSKSEAKDPAERTDDPVRMYLRDMGSVALLSREGEVAIAKRIEAGRGNHARGTLREPTRTEGRHYLGEELKAGKIYLRDIIDLDATHAGSDPGGMPAPVVVPTTCRSWVPPRLEQIRAAIEDASADHCARHSGQAGRRTDAAAEGMAGDGTINESGLDDDEDEENEESRLSICLHPKDRAQTQDNRNL